MSRIPRAFGLLLRILPERFRTRHREGIAHLAESYARDGSAGSRWMWTRAGIDVVVVGIGLRVGELRTGGGTMSDMLGRDLRFALKALLRRPGLTVVAVTTLGIGIGAITAIYSVVDGVLLRPLPYQAADRIGIIWHEFGEGAQDLPAVHALDAWDYRDRSRLLENVVVAGGREWIVGGADDPELVDVGTVQAGFFEFFGVTPFLGRGFTTDEDRPGAAPVVVLSHRLWARRFGGDPAIVGRSIEVAGTTMQVVGVAPERFRLRLPAEAFRLRDAELWSPLRLDPERQPPRNFTGYTAFVRLRSGSTFDQAQQEIQAMAERLRVEHPEHAASKLEARIVPLHADVVKQAEPMLRFLLGAVGFVLIIACANVTNLLIVRGHGRARELALRTALGAGRGSLLRLALMESVLLTVAGAAVGIVLAAGVVEALRSTAAASVPMLDAVTIDLRVLLFVAAVGVASALATGLLPALRALRSARGGRLAIDAWAAGSTGQRRFRDLLVIGEVAASLLLLVGTGMMVRSFMALGAVDPGFDLDDTLTMRISLPAGSSETAEKRAALGDRLLEEVLALPGVRAAAAINQLPLTGSGALQPYAYDEETASNWESVTADQRYVTRDFFDAIGATFVAGNTFEPSDMFGEGAIVIDDRLAARAFPNGDPIGKRLQVNPNDFPEHIRYARVVGVVEHIRLHDLSRPHLTQIWYPFRGGARFSLVVRGDGDPTPLAPAVRAIVGRLSPGAPVEDVQTLQELAATSLAPVRLSLALMAAFGLVALVLSSVGLYGVLSYSISHRTREIGVRMALGQSPGQVRGLVLRDGARLVGAALALGLLAAVGMGRVAAGLVYGVSPFDPVSYALPAALLAATATSACWVPARRATRIEPTQALRDGGRA